MTLESTTDIVSRDSLVGVSSPDRSNPPKRYDAKTQAVRTDGRSVIQSASSVGHNEHDIELLEYEWPDLPPMPAIKDAITRSRVSSGIRYVLPVDKSYNSINHRYRTDLRTMFLEPYASDHLQYEDTWVKLGAKIHLQPNLTDTKWTKRQLRSIPVHLNAESEKMLRLYLHSAPAGGLSSARRNPSNLRKRSNLFLPLKATVPAELTALRKDVEKIVRSVCHDDCNFVLEKLPEQQAQPMTTTPKQEARVDGKPDAESDTVQSACSSCQSHYPFPGFQSGPSVITDGHNNVVGRVCPVSGQDTVRTVPNCEKSPFESFEEFSSKFRSLKPFIPDGFKSNYLSEERNQEIWEWLHHGE